MEIDAYVETPQAGTETHAPHASPHHRAGERRWWSVKRAADHVGAGPKEIYKAVRAGTLKAVRLNGRGDIRTLREWVDEWMDQKRHVARPM